jgi:large subunit ribosomal protein L24e
MPRTAECDYCGTDIEPGTGTMLVLKNGTTIDYCSSKCEKNADLGREARDLNWTEAGRPEPTAAEQAEADAEEAGDKSETDRDTDIEDQGQAVDAPEDTPDLDDVADDEEPAGPEGEAEDEAAADADADPAEAVDEDDEAEADDSDAEEEEETEAEA